jgi:hypothetical protein
MKYQGVVGVAVLIPAYKKKGKEVATENTY